MFGEVDDNGLYENYSTMFTWDDTYPEYDDTYLVEIKGKYYVKTKGVFGLGSEKYYYSDVEDIVKDIYYNDLKVIIDNEYIMSIFQSFIDEHLPDTYLISQTFGASDYYFRIYKWFEEDNCYHYGKWVHMQFDKDSIEYDVTAGDLDEDGNFTVDPDSDYGTGKHGSTGVGVGVGDDLDDAVKDDEDWRKKNENAFDLSNASFTDVWEWFTSALAGLISSVGAIPEFFKQIFSFLPNTIYVLIGVGIVIAIILRFLGR